MDAKLFKLLTEFEMNKVYVLVMDTKLFKLKQNYPIISHALTMCNISIIIKHNPSRPNNVTLAHQVLSVVPCFTYKSRS